MADTPLYDKTTVHRRLVGEKRPLQFHRKRSFQWSKLFLIWRKISIPRILPRWLTKSKKRVAFSVLSVVVVVGAAAGFSYYENMVQNSPRAIYVKKLHSLTSQVSKYVSLPKDEQPITATVTDKSKLPHEAFFSHAQNGDKILMYKKHKEAILYRPSTKQVITTATLDFQNTPQVKVRHAPVEVAGASTSAQVNVVSVTIIPHGNPLVTPTPAPYHPQGKILIQPH